MLYSRRSRYSRSPSPHKRYNRPVSRSRSLSRSRSRSYDSSEVENPGNNLYVTGLSPRITKRDLEKHFSTEGKVEDIHLVVDPWSRESRGFGFVTMSTVEEADCCIKYLDRSVLEGRVIMVEKARRRRGRTPTPGRYLGLRTVRGSRRSPSYSPHHRSRSSSYSSERCRSRSRSYSPDYRRRRRSYSPFNSSQRRSYNSRGRSYSRSRSPHSRSPVSRRDQYYSPCYHRDSSPDYHYYRSRYRSVSQSISPRAHRYSRRSYSRSLSPRQSSKRRYSPRVPSYRGRGYAPSMSPPRSRRSSRGISHGSSYKHAYSEESFFSMSRSRSTSQSSRSVSSTSPSSRSVSKSASP